MAETKNPGDKTLSVSSKTLSLKPRTDAGTVRQSFSHGRTKQVVVEKVVTRRLAGDKAEPEKPAAKAASPKTAAAAKPAAGAKPAAAKPAQPAADTRSSGVVLRRLTDEERAARANALADSKLREAEERKIAEEEAKLRAQRETIERAEREAAV